MAASVHPALSDVQAERLMVIVDAAVPAWTFEICPLPVAAKNASAVLTGNTSMANPRAATNERLRPIRPALTTRVKTRLTDCILPCLLGVTRRVKHLPGVDEAQPGASTGSRRKAATG